MLTYNCSLILLTREIIVILSNTEQGAHSRCSAIVHTLKGMPRQANSNRDLEVRVLLPSLKICTVNPKPPIYKGQILFILKDVTYL